MLKLEHLPEDQKFKWTLISTPDGPHFHTSLSKSTGCYRQYVEQCKGAMKEADAKAMENNRKSATAGKTL